MITLESTTPSVEAPTWAVLQRRLIDAMNQAVYLFVEKYIRDDGELIWGNHTLSRDGADDFYESCYNWSLLYVLGGGDHLLTLQDKIWEGVTRQLTRMGMLRHEYELGYDQFHQSESYIAFYFLCMADPTNPKWVDRAQRFAGFYLNEDPLALNYDPHHRIIRAPHNGAGGPRWGFFDGEPAYHWSQTMSPYGLPYQDVPGVCTFEDLKDVLLAQRMGQAMQERMGKGDVVANLGATSLATNAWLLTGEDKYRRWVLEYVEAWMDRARANGGLLPDNVGLSGQVGEYLNGRWYGGLYGWSWPHGFYNIAASATVAALNAFLLTRDTGYLDLPRWQMDKLIALGQQRKITDLPMSLRHHWAGIFSALESDETFVVPYRYADSGWFDYQPMSPIYPAAVWNVSMADADWQRLEFLRANGNYDWRRVIPFRSKEDSGHEQPWLRYIVGDNAGYPERILSAAYQVVCRRLALIRCDDADLRHVNIHHWQELNPVTTEALVQLTTGAPQHVYYGGFLMARVCYFDPARKRPGLPEDVAALVEKVSEDQIGLWLVNLNPVVARELIVQAGGFGEHEFVSATFPNRVSDYPGSQQDYAPPALVTEPTILPLSGNRFKVHLPPGHEIRLQVTMRRFVHTPAYRRVTTD
ncbi:MAG: hypothetical protein RMN25_08120 [Anaerolineae bacterium]|nr:hypothetical protein [Thermoflexales bacterium]MDW8407738.1 hypothetical protein [Anaerolineae bacterium]